MKDDPGPTRATAGMREAEGQMAQVCVRHPFELSENFCSQCGLEFCRDCIVYPKGPKKPALCVSCALAASGVRSTAAVRPPISKRELKRRMKERRDEARVLAMHEREPEPISPISNPFSPGWAMSSDEHPLGAVPGHEPAGISTPVPPPPPPPPVPVPAPDDFVRTEPPTLADLLPSVPPTPDAAGSDQALSMLADLGPAPLEEEPEEIEEERRPRTLPLLRRRDPEKPEKTDEGAEASEMIAWLDEVFAPKDPR